MTRTVVIATAVAGTLDILFATILTLLKAGEPGGMLRLVASGPFPHATEWGTAGAVLGLAVHFALMALMAIGFVVMAKRWPTMLSRPAISGIAYGLLTYVLMNLIVVPVRFDRPLPPPPIAILSQLFAHIVLVGLPFAYIARRNLSQSVSITR